MLSLSSFTPPACDSSFFLYILLNLFILFRSSKYGIITGCLLGEMVKVRFCTATAHLWHTRERESISPGQVVQGTFISASGLRGGCA